MKRFEIRDLQQRQEAAGQPYLEFLRVPALSMGMYVLPAGAQDTQQPHEEDETYYIVSGRGRIQVDNENQPVQAGTIVYVSAGTPHYFYNIKEDLTILVFFAPAES